MRIVNVLSLLKVISIAFVVVFCSWSLADELPVNLATQAIVSASSQFSDEYRPELAVRGITPSEFRPGDDWAVKAEPTGSFKLQWNEPVEATQIVYYARVDSPMLECFKDFEVYLNGSDEPAVKGVFEHRRGPQLIGFPKQRVTEIRIEFLSSHPDSPNPGAAEIAVFGTAVSVKQLEAAQVPAEEKTPQALGLRRDLLDGKLGFKDILLVKRMPLNLSHVYVYHVEGYRPGGGIYIFSPDEEGGKLNCIFDAGEGMITTADLSYDGKQVIFAMRQGGHVNSNPVAHIEDISCDPNEENNYQVFKINIDGTGFTQLTHGPHNNLDPCWLPDGGIAFISDRKPAYAYCYVVTSPVLYRMQSDGSKQKRLSANYLMDFTPSVLDDGRIIYTRWEYVDRAACPTQSLWTINPDGTGLTGFYGNRVISPGTFMDAQSIPGTSEVLATATNHNGSCRGGIVKIDPTKGSNSRESIQNLTPEIDVYAQQLGGGPWGNGMLDRRIGGTYEKPMPIDDHHFLVSKGGTIQLRDFDANVVSLVSTQSTMGFYCPTPIRQTRRPPVVTGHFLDHDAELNEDGSVTGSWATVLMQDVYNGLEPHVKRGEIKQVAVVQEVEKSTHSPQINLRPDGQGMRSVAVFGFQFPVVSCGATYAAKKVWGVADVDPDGSAAFKVPAEVPIYFLALDKEGRALQRMRSFTHLMPGEVQGCIGCHADRNSVTTNTRHQLSATGEIQELKAPDWGVKGFSYQEVVQGVFDRNCTQCHNEREQPGNVDLTGDMTDFFNVSYDVLCRTETLAQDNWSQHGTPSGPEFDALRGMSPYIQWIWTINGAGHNILETTPRRWGSPASKLAEIIRSGHPDADGNPQVNVSDDDRRRVYLWLDLNIPYYGTSSSNHKDRLGSRRMLPIDLDSTLAQVADRRCSSCHDTGIPRKFYTRVANPQNNSFLLAPLAKQEGGTQKCGEAVFRSKDDPDYQLILRTFDAIHQLLKERPRADMKAYEVLGNEP